MPMYASQSFTGLFHDTHTSVGDVSHHSAVLVRLIPFSFQTVSCNTAYCNTQALPSVQRFTTHCLKEVAPPRYQACPNMIFYRETKKNLQLVDSIAGMATQLETAHAQLLMYQKECDLLSHTTVLLCR